MVEDVLGKARLESAYKHTRTRMHCTMKKGASGTKIREKKEGLYEKCSTEEGEMEQLDSLH